MSRFWKLLLEFFRKLLESKPKPPTQIPPTPVPPTPVPPTPVPSGVEGKLLVLHNEHRISKGKKQFELNEELSQAAQKHSVWMAENRDMSHTGANGSNVGERVVREHYSWASVGENIAVGYTSPEAVVSGWMRSRGHRANILGDYKEVGFGVAERGGRKYWTTVFATARWATSVISSFQLITPEGIDADNEQSES